MSKNALILTTIAGFLPQFEMNDFYLLRDLGYTVHYASNLNNPVYKFDMDELKAQGIVLHHIEIKKSPINFLSNLQAIKAVKKIIIENGIEMIHCHNPLGGVTGRISSFLSHKNPYVIYTVHGFHFYSGAPKLNWLFYYSVERLLARLTDCIITINREDYQRACRFKLRKNGIVRQIHGVGLDFEKFKSRPEKRAEIRKNIGIPEDAFHIVTAAELNQNKNQKVIIDAIASMERKDIYYSICGSGPSDAWLHEYIKRKNLEDRVRLLGYRDDMEDILQGADCFAFPSIREGLGMAAVEALAVSIPVIAADNRGTKEYMKDGINGIVCRAGDIDGFAQAIIRLADDKDFYKKVSSVARESVNSFRISETEKIMREVYQKIKKKG